MKLFLSDYHADSRLISDLETDVGTVDLGAQVYQ